jgi:hypothetical protein
MGHNPDFLKKYQAQQQQQPQQVNHVEEESEEEGPTEQEEGYDEEGYPINFEEDYEVVEIETSGN